MTKNPHDQSEQETETRPLVTIEQAASLLPPIEEGDWAPHGCARCGAPTAAYQRLADRGMVPICGDCYSEDMLHAIKDIREQRQREQREERGERGERTSGAGDQPAR